MVPKYSIMIFCSWQVIALSYVHIGFHHLPPLYYVHIGFKVSLRIIISGIAFFLPWINRRLTMLFPFSNYSTLCFRQQKLLLRILIYCESKPHYLAGVTPTTQSNLLESSSLLPVPMDPTPRQIYICDDIPASVRKTCDSSFLHLVRWVRRHRIHRS